MFSSARLRGLKWNEAGDATALGGDIRGCSIRVSATRPNRHAPISNCPLRTSFFLLLLFDSSLLPVLQGLLKTGVEKVQISLLSS
jgi:hypothetical protein